MYCDFAERLPEKHNPCFSFTSRPMTIKLLPSAYAASIQQILLMSEVNASCSDAASIDARPPCRSVGCEADQLSGSYGAFLAYAVISHNLRRPVISMRTAGHSHMCISNPMFTLSSAAPRYAGQFHGNPNIVSAADRLPVLTDPF